MGIRPMAVGIHYTFDYQTIVYPKNFRWLDDLSRLAWLAMVGPPAASQGRATILSSEPLGKTLWTLKGTETRQQSPPNHQLVTSCNSSIQPSNFWETQQNINITLPDQWLPLLHPGSDWATFPSFEAQRCGSLAFWTRSPHHPRQNLISAVGVWALETDRWDGIKMSLRDCHVPRLPRIKSESLRYMFSLQTWLPV